MAQSTVKNFLCKLVYQSNTDMHCVANDPDGLANVGRQL